MKKKIVGLILALVLPFAVFAGCYTNKPDNSDPDSKTFTMYVPDGAPLLAAADVVNGGVDFGNDKIKGEIVTGTQIGPALIAKTPDIALAPINACATAFNKTQGEYVLCGVSIWGLNYIVSKDEGKESLSDFVGETIYAFQQAGTPGVTLMKLIEMYDLKYNIITDENNVADNKINLVFLQDASKVRDALQGNLAEAKGAKHGLLSEPVVTAMQSVAKSTISTQDLWKAKNDGNSYPQVGLVVRKSLVENRKSDVEAFINYMESREKFLRENPEAVAKLAVETLESTGLPPVAVCKNFVSSTRGQAAFTFGKITDSKKAVEDYLAALGNSLVGGAQPASAFYFGA